MRASNQSLHFLFVKLSQILICIIVVVLEATSYFAWTKYVDELDSSGLYPQFQITKSAFFDKKPLETDPSITYNGQVKIWYYFVIIITLFGTIIYLLLYRWLWNNAIKLILMESFFFILWFSAGIANLDPWYSGPGLRCNLINTNHLNIIIVKLAELAQLQCNTQVASLSFCWINVGLYVTSVFMAKKRTTDIAWNHMSTLGSTATTSATTSGEHQVIGSRRSSRGSRNISSRYTNSSGGSPAFF